MSARAWRARARGLAVGPMVGPMVMLLVLLLGWLLVTPAKADTSIYLYQSLRGNINFTGTEATIRDSDNSSPCTLVKNGVATAALKGIPSDGTVISAQLYWAGSGNTPDSQVNMDGVAITAPSGRRFTSATVGSGFNFFSAAADVTAQVAKKGNGTYTFSGLSVDTGNPWCASSAVLGGFALVVVYSSPSESFRLLNIYEGFQAFYYSGINITLNNFNVPNPLPAGATARIGHVTWEGDPTLSGGGEKLLFNGYEMTDSMNPSGNQFNSASNIDGNAQSWGIDFDAYSVTSPVIQAGQTSATTAYQTGQDLVMLSSEIVAMPSVPKADLQLTMTRTGSPSVTAPMTYTLTVKNAGTDPEVGPVVVTDTLPAGLKLLSTGGAGWSCTSAAGTGGTTVVTCSQAGPLAAGASMTPLTLNVVVSSYVSGGYTNTATVSGKTDSPNGNNTATDTSSMSNPNGTFLAMYTREICNANQPVVFAAGDTGCHAFIGPVTAAATNVNVYITVVSVSGSQPYAVALANYDQSVSVNIGVTCAPNSSQAVSYAGKSFDCGGATQGVSVILPANKPTVSNVAAFSYADVGRLVLSLSYQGSTYSTTFISRPSDMRVKDVIRADNFYDTTGAGGSTTKYYGFTTAGEAFSLRVGAIMANGSYAPSFGKEAAQASFTPQILYDAFGIALAPATAAPITANNTDNIVRNAFVGPSSYTVDGNSAGTMVGSASYFEAGSFALTPYLADYMGTGQVGGAPTGTDPSSTARIVAGTRVIGRFYPDHFETNADPRFDCPSGVSCPTAYSATGPAWPVGGAVYSAQPFSVYVNAYGLQRNGQPNLLRLFQNVQQSDAGGTQTRSTVSMSAVAQPNGTATVGGFTMPTALAGSANDASVLTGAGALTLANGYSATARAANNWGAPKLFYLRATMSESRNASGGASSVTINSVAPSGAAAGTQYEDGLAAVNGRLLVGNAFGSEILRLPVGLTAQYWTGSAWVANANDGDSLVASTIAAATTAPGPCTRTFAQSASSGACKANVVTAANAGTPIRILHGVGSLVLVGPGRQTSGVGAGSIDFLGSGGEAAAWLPSTRARATFGLYKSPVIYLREVY